MAPIIKTYQGKKPSLSLKNPPISAFRREDPFDRVFNTVRDRVFSSSSEASGSSSQLELITPETVNSTSEIKLKYFKNFSSGGSHSATPKGIIKKRRIGRKCQSPFFDNLDKKIVNLKLKKSAKKKDELLKPVCESTPAKSSSDSTLGIAAGLAAIQLEGSSCMFQSAIPMTSQLPSPVKCGTVENSDDEVQEAKVVAKLVPESSCNPGNLLFGHTFVSPPSPILDCSASEDAADALSKSCGETSNVDTLAVSSGAVQESSIGLQPSASKSSASRARNPLDSSDLDPFAGFGSAGLVTPQLLKRRREWLNKQKTCDMYEDTPRRAISMNDIILARAHITDQTEASDKTASTVKATETSHTSLPKDDSFDVNDDIRCVSRTRGSSGSLRNSPKQSSKSFTTCEEIPQCSTSSGDSPESRSSEDLSRSFNEEDEDMVVHRPTVPSQIPLHSIYEQRTLEPLQENLEEHVEEMEEESSSLSSKSSPAETPDSISNRTPNMRRKSSRYSEERSPTGRSSIGRALVTPDLNSVVEESDSDSVGSSQIDELPPLEHFTLIPGKKYRRSLSILRNLDQKVPEDTNLKGRRYCESVAEVVRLQNSTFTGDAGDESVSLQSMKQRLSVRRRSLMKLTTPPPRRRSTLRATIYETPCASFSVFGSHRGPLTPQLTRAILDGTIQTSGSMSRDSIRTSFRPDVSIVTERGAIGDAGMHLDSSSPGDASAEPRFRDAILRICGQTDFVSFPEILKSDCYEGGRKLGEGVYGEVFEVTRGKEKTVIKIIPVEGDFCVNGAEQKTYHEIMPELLISVELSGLRLPESDKPYLISCGFVPILNVSLVKGRYPLELLDLWNQFDKLKGSDNDYPKVFDEEQIYVVIEQANGGTDLESYSFSTAKQVVSIFKQVAFSLAVAECAMEFEHRDLHWGNILVSRTKEMQMSFWLEGVEYKIPTNGVKATIIDYTLSRIIYRNLYPMYQDLSKDPDLFVGTGDMQFDIYRQMKKDVANDWLKHVPKTNVRWLHYLVDKMLKKVKYQRKTAKVHQDSMAMLQIIESWLDTCDSAHSVALSLK